MGDRLAALPARLSRGAGGQGRRREGATRSSGRGVGAAARRRGRPPPRGTDGAEGDAKRRDGAGEVRPGSPATCNAVEWRAGVERGGGEGSLPPTQFYKKRRGGHGRKAAVRKVRAEREARRRRGS